MTFQGFDDKYAAAAIAIVRKWYDQSNAGTSDIPAIAMTPDSMKAMATDIATALKLASDNRL